MCRSTHKTSEQKQNQNSLQTSMNTTVPVSEYVSRSGHMAWPIRVMDISAYMHTNCCKQAKLNRIHIMIMIITIRT